MEANFVGLAFQFESDSRPGIVHTSIGDGINYRACTCEGFARGGRICKHIREVDRILSNLQEGASTELRSALGLGPSSPQELDF